MCLPGVLEDLAEHEHGPDADDRLLEASLPHTLAGQGAVLQAVPEYHHEDTGPQRVGHAVEHDLRLTEIDPLAKHRPDRLHHNEADKTRRHVAPESLAALGSRGQLGGRRQRRDVAAIFREAAVAVGRLADAGPRGRGGRKQSAEREEAAEEPGGAPGRPPLLLCAAGATSPPLLGGEQRLACRRGRRSHQRRNGSDGGDAVRGAQPRAGRVRERGLEALCGSRVLGAQAR
mmetsp:Transcript_27993/g.80703  ORF Transcript_27993/g.80703 Transcript_27993/m.80703 type:complete len:231 (+) Transcript_27993:63-755(+)